MKFNYLFFVSMAMITACGENKPAEKTSKNEPQTISKSEEKPSVKEPESVDFKRLNLDTLVPLTIMKEESENVYEKFGIDFGGYCYGCDAANLVLSDKEIQFINVCDPAIMQVFRIEKKSLTKDGFTLDSEGHQFVFSKIDNAPVYKFKVLGKSFRNPDLRLNTYFTTPKVLPKFEVHDCGNFQG